MADDGKNPNDELSTNLFSDIAPILALFGEPFARQFMSESMGWLDHLIFALAPLGILTAVVSAIRVGGPEWLRAIVGRARENVTTVELELMSSTSDEVCELWNGTGVVRTVGNPEVKEIIYLDHLKNEDSCGLYTVEAALAMIQTREQEKRKALVTSDESLEGDKQKGSKVNEGSMGGLEAGLEFRYAEREDPLLKCLEKLQFWKKKQTDVEIMAKANELMENHGGAPNISLNLHGGTKAWEQWAGLVFGLVIQLGVLVFSGFTVYHPRFNTRLTIEGNKVASFAFPLMATGTIMMAVGLTLCCVVVDRGSQEAMLSLEKDGKSGENRFARMLWLQRKHAVADQQFNTYAIFGRNKEEHEMLSRVLLSRRSKPSAVRSSSFAQRHPIIQKLFANRDQIDTTFGSLLSLIGFMLQLIALRQLHWSTSISHLVALLLMSLVRAWLRRGLIVKPHAVQIPDEHELDWLALKIASGGFKDEEDSAKHAAEYPDGKKGKAESVCNWWPSTNTTDGEEDDENLNIKTQMWIDAGLFDPSSTCNTDGPINQAVKIRQRLGSLTNWKGSMSDLSIKISKSVSAVMDGLALSYQFDGGVGTVFHWNIRACMERRNLGKPGKSGTILENIRMTVRKTETGWEADATEIEAVLSLWLHHITEQKGTIGQGEKLKKSDWLQQSNLSKIKAIRLVAPHTSQCALDINRWIGDSPMRVEPRRASQLLEQGSVTNGAAGVFVLGTFPSPSEHDSSDFLVVQSEFEQNILVLMAQHIFMAFLADYAIAVEPGQFGIYTSARNADQVNLADASTFSLLKLESAPLADISQRIETAGLGARFEARLWLISALNRERKLPFKPVLDVVRQLSWTNESQGNWVEIVSTYSKLFKGKYGYCHHTSEDFRSMIVIGVDMLDSIHTYIQYGPCSAIFKRHIGAAGEDSPFYIAAIVHFRIRLARLVLEFANRDPFFRFSALEDWYKFQFRRDYKVVFKLLRTESERYSGKYTHLFEQEHVARGVPVDRRFSQMDPMHWTALHYVAIHRGESQGGYKDVMGEALSSNTGFDNYTSFASLVLWKQGRRMIDAPDLLGMSPLQCGISFRPNKESIKFFWENGADFNRRDRRGRSAFQHLAHIDYKKQLTRDFMTEVAGKQKFLPNEPDHLGKTLLLTASYEGAFDTVGTLLALEGDIKEVDKFRWTALHLALVKSDNIALVQKLVRVGGFDLDVQGCTEFARPLHVCAALNRIEAATFLLKEGANVNGLDSVGSSPLHYATTPEMMELLIKSGANVNLSNRRGETPLHWTQLYFANNLENVRLLIEAGAVVDCSSHLRTGIDCPLQLLARLRVTDDINILEAEPSLSGASRDIGDQGELKIRICQNPSGYPLCSCLECVADHANGVRDAQQEEADVILDKNSFLDGWEAELERIDERPRLTFGISDLRAMAFERGTMGFDQIPKALQDYRKAQIARMLVDAGASVNSVSRCSQGGSKRWSPLHYAAENHDVALMKVLVEAGADVNEVLHCKDKRKNAYFALTPLAIAVASCASISTRIAPILEDLLDRSYPKAILERCNQESLAAVQLLLDHGADPNGVLHSLPPLHAAVAFSKLDHISDQTIQLMQLLLNRGADIDSTSAHFNTSVQHNSQPVRLTALHLAVDMDSVEFVRFFIKHGANPNAVDSRSITPAQLAVKIPTLQRQLFLTHRMGAEMTVESVWYLEESSKCFVTGAVPPSGRRRPVEDRELNINAVRILECLIEGGADIEAGSEVGESLLQLAIIQTLNSLKSPNPSNINNTDISQPPSFDFCDIRRLLVSRGANVNTRLPNGGTIVHSTVSSRPCIDPQTLDSVAVSILSSLELQNRHVEALNAKDIHGRTPLYYARLNRLEACERLLISCGAQDGPESQPPFLPTPQQPHEALTGPRFSVPQTNLQTFQPVMPNSSPSNGQAGIPYNPYAYSPSPPRFS